MSAWLLQAAAFTAPGRIAFDAAILARFAQFSRSLRFGRPFCIQDMIAENDALSVVIVKSAVAFVAVSTVAVAHPRAE